MSVSETSGMDVVSHPPYFAVSPAKLMVLSFATANLYSIWWFYKNWSRIKQRENSEIRPFWRGLFQLIWCYACFARIRATVKEMDIPAFLPAGLLAIAYILNLMVCQLADQLLILTSISGVWLLPVQVVANEINSTAVPSHQRNARFNVWEIALVIFGSLLMVLACLGTFLKR